MRKVLSLLAVVIVTAAMLFFSWRGVDFDLLGRLLSKGNYLILLPFEFSLVLFFLFTALRWSLILRPLGNFSVWGVTPAIKIGFGGNDLLPARLGNWCARSFSQGNSENGIAGCLER